MGRDKSLLKIRGREVIRWVARPLEDVFSRVFVVANEEAPFRALNFHVERDILPGNDSLGGLHTAVARGEASHVFVAGCDMPFLQVPLLRGLAERAEGWDVVIPVLGGFAEPLCALYSRACEGAIRRRIEAGRLKMIGFHDEVRVLRVEEDTWRAWDPEGRSFRNLNTPEEFEAAMSGGAQNTEGEDGR